jgi:hypothetical protein
MCGRPTSFSLISPLVGSKFCTIKNIMWPRASQKLIFSECCKTTPAPNSVVDPDLKSVDPDPKPVDLDLKTVYPDPKLVDPL